MNNVFELLEDIKIKPELYLGSKKLTHLYHFINGYVFKSINTEDEKSTVIKELHFWLPPKTGIDIENWLENLLVKSNYNEEKALELFFKYFIDFKKEKY